MKQQEARNLILEEWDRWIAVADGRDRAARPGKHSLKFFFELQDSQIAAVGFPVPRPRQMADHPRLAARCRARHRHVGDGAPHRALAPAARGPRQVARQDLKRASISSGHQQPDGKRKPREIGEQCAEQPRRIGPVHRPEPARRRQSQIAPRSQARWSQESTSAPAWSHTTGTARQRTVRIRRCWHARARRDAAGRPGSGHDQCCADSRDAAATRKSPARTAKVRAARCR